jgi:cytochrome P450
MTDLIGTASPATAFDPASASVQRDPYPYYHWLLSHDPVHCGAQGIWYVSRYADVRTVFGDPRFGRAGIRDFWAGLVGSGPLSEILRHTIFFQDDPDHARLRALLSPAFTPRRVRELRTDIEQIVGDLLDPLRDRGELDVVNDVAYPLALTVIARVLGVPDEDRPRLRAWSVGIAPTLDLAATPAEIARGQVAMGEFVDYLRELIADGSARSVSGLIGMMLAANRADAGAGPTASMSEILSTVVTLVFAGHDTVTNLIGNGVLALVRHPGQLALLRDDPGLLPQAVEEFLRYDSPVQSNSRKLDEDLELGGRTIRRGEFVVGLIGAANHDPAVFPEPGRFDITRTGIQPVSFGAGMRFCLGAMLARMEAKAAFRRLVELADLRLAVPDDDLVYLRSTMFRGVESLPVTFRPGSGRC